MPEGGNPLLPFLFKLILELLAVALKNYEDIITVQIENSSQPMCR